MAGGVASALAAAARRGGRELDGDLGLFEVDEFWLGAGRRGARPAGDAARQPVPRPARPLRRARDDRRPLGRRRRRARPATRARAQRRRPAGGRPRPRARDAALLRRRRRLARPARAPARVGLQALPPLRPRLRLRGRLPRPPRPLPLPQLRPAPRPSPAVVAADVELRGIRTRRVHARTPRAASARVELPLPGLYNVYNALGAAALCLALGVAARRRRRRARGRRARLRARRDARARRARRRRSCWSRTRPAPTRCCARSRSRASELDLLRRAQRPHRRRPRRLVGVGRRLGGARRRTCGA